MIRTTAIVVAGFALAACGEKPVACADYQLTYGERASVTTFTKANNAHTWSKCADNKTRKVTCTTGHLSAWKCLCNIDGQDKLESRREADVRDDRPGATADANAVCHWKLQ